MVKFSLEIVIVTNVVVQYITSVVVSPNWNPGCYFAVNNCVDVWRLQLNLCFSEYETHERESKFYESRTT